MVVGGEDERSRKKGDPGEQEESRDVGFRVVWRLVTLLPWSFVR